jgi:hypothetical protein
LVGVVKGEAIVARKRPCYCLEIECGRAPAVGLSFADGRSTH